MKHVVAMLVLVGCQGGDGESNEGVTEEAVLNPTSPFVGPAVNDLAAYPPLLAHGRVTEGSYAVTSPFVPHEARFTSGEDLAAGPVVDSSDPFGTADAWADTLGAAGANAHLHPPMLKARVQSALASAKLHMNDLSAEVLEDVAKIFELIPGFTPAEYDSEIAFAAWQPPRARWLDSQWAFLPRTIFSPPAPERHLLYPTPAAFGLVPERGARLYCAARELARQQVQGSLGEKVLLPITILGQDIDIGVFEPTAYVDQPKKFIAPGVDGVQAFTVPLQLGLKITPVRPFLPSLPELRTPLVLTTADAELVTDTDRGLVWVDSVCFGSWLCVPVIRPEYQKRFKTTAHVDSVMTAGRSMKTSAKIPLFWAGALLVRLNVGFAAAVGMQAPALAGEPVVPRPRVLDDRILAFAIPQPAWPAGIRKTATSAPYLDGFWRLQQNYFNPDPGNQFYDVHSGETPVAVVSTAPQSPFRTAVLTDDDHHVAPASELAILAGLEGIIGLNASIARIEISASGNVKGTLGMAHDVRDGVSVDNSLLSPQPITNLTITPTTYGHVELLFKVNFHLHIDLPIFDDIDVNYDLVNESIPIGPELNEVWIEEHRVRLGTGSTVGADVTQWPAFTSRTGKTVFDTFREPVNACLADPTDVPNVPPPCKSTPASGEPPRAHACMYTPVSVQIDPCLHIPANPVDPAAKCEAAKLTYLCGAVSQQQWFGAEYVLAHRLVLPEVDGTYSADLERISEIADACSRSDPTFTPADPSAWFKGLFKVASCDAAATLMTADAVVGVRGSAVTDGKCRP
jgi:hypothetical protein